MLRYLRYTILIYYGFKLTFAHACSCQTHNPQEINIKNFSNFALYAFRVPLIYYFLLASLIEDNARPSCCLLALYIYACTSSLLPFLWWEGLINIGYVTIKILKLNLRSFWIKKKKMRAAVIGGGISGLVSAYVLAKAGVEVVLYEKEDSLGGHAKTVTIDGVDLDLCFMVFNRVSVIKNIIFK